METPLRTFLRTETGSASVLAGATVAALIWANISISSYDKFWATQLSFLVGSSGVVIDLREFVNSGLMALFFLVVGLEARREFDMGELRVRSRVALPFLAGLGGMVVPIGIYLLFNAGRPSQHGWGMAMSTDTAFALGALALVGRRLPDRVRTYLLTFSVVDDLAGIAVIAVVYSGQIHVVPLLFGVGFLALVLVIRARGVRYGPAYLAIGIAAWVAFLKSGVDPIVVGLVMGLLTYAYSATRASLEQASEAFRLFREQPTAELAATAQGVVRTAISPNDRLSQIFHPWTSYVIVPLFALANAGIVLNAGFLARAYTSPVTLGILVGYLVGKPLGTAGCAWLVSRLSHGRLSPPVGWGAVIGAGTVAGIGFTVSLLIASLALQRHRAGRGEAGHPVRGAGRDGPDLGHLPGGEPAADPDPAACAARHERGHHRPGGARWTRTGITSAARRKRRSPWSSTGTSSAPTAARRSRPYGSCCGISATSGTCGGTCR